MQQYERIKENVRVYPMSYYYLLHVLTIKY